VTVAAAGAAPSRETLDRVAARGAAFRAEMDRADGAFRFQISAVANGSDGHPAPARDELLALLPPGSRWTEALGWSAYFGWPLSAAGRHFWAVGAEEVCPAPERGAFPAVRVYLHTAPPTALLEALAATLDPGAPTSATEAAEPRVLVTPLPGTTPLASLPEQAALLRRAAAACARGGTPLFRTAVLAEGEALPLVTFPRRPPRGVDRCFLGVPDALARTFSAQARALIYLRGFWG
jgi:hypothetical protein